MRTRFLNYLMWAAQAALLASPFLAAANAQLPPSLARLARGRELFRHNWTPGDPLSPEGDGLGPVHNAASCVACHHQGGVGGGGPRENDVELLTVADSEKSKHRGDAAKLGVIHPGFAEGRTPPQTIVLHRFGTNPNYEGWRESLLGEALPPGLSPRRKAAMARAIERRKEGSSPVRELPSYKGRRFLLSRRNTPALFGSALIDSIPDDVLKEVARRQQERGGPVSGRIAPLAGGRVGRFGWRGQTATLRDFVLGACANELGLQVRDQLQGLDPFDRTYRPKGVDLNAEQCDELLAFVASLPAPGRRVPHDDAAALANYGEQLFHSVGCAECHPQRLGEVDGIYSDLLLHDMGSGFADPTPAAPATVVVGQTISSGYFGGGVVDKFVTLKSGILQEWRTPPLWGVADSAPYLHDGRAQTLTEAIMLHGGEAGPSVAAFRTLPPADRSALVGFLNTLSIEPVLR